MRRKRLSEQATQERWLVSYSVLVTLLFALFVILYATSRAEREKLKDVPREAEQAELKSFGELLEKRLSNEFRREELSETLEIVHDERGVVVRLSAKAFFEPGSAEVREAALPVLAQIAKALARTNRKIRVEGHTDDTPAPGHIMGAAKVGVTSSGNWELSTARATGIVRYLIEEAHLNARRFEAAGFAEFRPLGDNATEAGRRLNRRVELVVLRHP